MSQKYAYIDEFGAFGFLLDKPDVASHFIICAIIVEEQDLPIVEAGLIEIQRVFFQGSEIKSSKVRYNHKKRTMVLEKMLELPFHIYAFVADKTKIYENSGLRFKKSFYKFLNNYVYEELRLNFNGVKIVADEMGTNEYKEEFYRYIKKRQNVTPTLFGDLYDDNDLLLVDSRNSVINQLADFCAGSLAFAFDNQKKERTEGYHYDRILSSKINRIKIFPESIENFDIQHSAAAANYDPEIASVCYNKAKSYVLSHKESDVPEVRMQLIVLEYLLFRFMNNAMRKYIPTEELIKQLVYSGYEKLSQQTFRNKIIAPLRDSEVIISSSKNGYKIPSTEAEVCSFVNHGKTIIMPMLSRLKKCNDVIAMGTNSRVRLFERAEYSDLRQLLADTE